MAKRRRAHLFGIGETKRRHHRRSSGSKGWSGVDTVMTIAALGAVGFVGYFVLRSGKGIEEGLQTGGDWLKDATDAINSSGEAVGRLSYDFQEGGKNVAEWFGAAGESLGNTGCHLQRGFGILLSPFGVKPLECRGAGSWVSNQQARIIIAKRMAGGSPKPYPKITNNVYKALMVMGADPNLL